MVLIRVALIGLSSSSPSWLSLAHLSYLLSARGQQKFQIVALQNSSLSAAEAAIKKYNFDPTVVTAYGTPEDLAKDEDVELVVSGTRVDVHYGNLKGVLEGWKATGKTSGKGLYSEWPLASNLQQVEELIALAKETGIKTVVGTQGLASPVVKKIGEVLKSGRAGKVLSSEMRLSGVTAEREAMQEKTEYFTKRETGGNMWSIGGGHLIDLLQSALGELQTNVKSHFHIQRPLVPLKDSETGAITRAVTSNTPDLLYVVGSLPASDTVQQNASLHLRMRRGPPFPGESAFVWTLTGEKGEIRVTSKESVAIILGAGEVKIEIHDYETDKVEELPAPARNVGSVYEGVWEAWTEGVSTSQEGGDKRYNDWEVAGRRHELLERLLVDNGF
ncbi:hypothetical protein QR685DRAFT_283387 [Neurospora intermedia]|uniref:Gfo/Idh/MocA-like oxidoreductase N-terminal domain-containing protein n=1 Tax=Neurospora intermedia TaxID=5142 RepID=A0ABR3DAB8_NEUIN